MKFLKGMFVFILIAIIVGGVGYIGYSTLSMNHSGHNMSSTANAPQSAQAELALGKSSESTKNQQGMQGMAGMSGLQQASSDQSQQNNSQQSGNNQIVSGLANLALQNRDELNRSISALNDALKDLTMDPYAPSTNSSSSMGIMQGTTQPGSSTDMTMQGASQTGNAAPAATQGNNTTINIYPQSNTPNTQQNSMNTSNTMQNMSTTYDVNKMEQLHSGLYKISVGMALLDQLNNDLIGQAETSNVNTQYPAQYYSNQYYLMVQNKNKLSQALTYIDKASDMVNINPYVSSTGLVYDKDRMNQIHQGVFKLAEGVASMNKLNDDFTKQAINLSNIAQNYINNTTVNSTDTTMNMPVSNSTGLFGNISMSSIFNIILIVFVIGLIFGIFGFVFSLFKNPGRKTAGKEDAVI